MRLPATATKPPAITENAWSTQFRQLFRTLGWDGYHTFFSKFSEHGFPDWVLVNTVQKRLVYVELKAERGRLSEHQERWRDNLQACGQEWYCWRPSDFEEAARVLRSGGGQRTAEVAKEDPDAT